MNSKRYCVIMAGGVGSRFWPLSRHSCPKQFLDIMGCGRSFLRQTYDRFRAMIPSENIYVVTAESLRGLVAEQIPELLESQILCEPIGRNTAPCICYAAHRIAARDKDAQMVVTPADHFVGDEAGLMGIVDECFNFSKTNNALLTVGVRPSRPETGYGYVQVSSSEPISRVKCFTEKPKLELAQAFVQCGEFFWNAGIFVWRATDILEAIKLHMSETYSLFEPLEKVIGTEHEAAVVSRAFSECRSTSIDYGVMEVAENVYVRVGEFGWSDIGTWGSIYQLSERDEQGNAGVGESYLPESRDCFISVPEGKIAVVAGLDGYIVVDSDDALLICPRSHEQSIKDYVDELKFRGNTNKI